MRYALVGSMAFLNFVTVKKNTLYFLREKIENEFCLSLNLEISFYIFQECQVMGTTTSYSFSEPYFSFFFGRKKLSKIAFLEISQKFLRNFTSQSRVIFILLSLLEKT